MDGRALLAWPGLKLLQPLTGGARNQVHLATDGRRRLVVRRSMRPAAAIEWEVELLVALADAGFRVPRPLPAGDGRPVVDGVVVSTYVEGRTPAGRRDWQRVADVLADLHRWGAGHPQRPGFASSAELLVRTAGGDVDLGRLAPAQVAMIRRAWAAVQVGPPTVVHGDAGAPNIRIGDDGCVGLIDWDEARVDVAWMDLAALPLEVDLPGAPLVARGAVVAAGVAWEAAASWTAEPAYARRRLAELARLE